MVKAPLGRPGNRSPGRRPGAAAWPGRPSRTLRHWPSVSLRVATGLGPSGRARTRTSRAAAARRPGITMIALGSFWGAGGARSGGLRVCCQNQVLCYAVVRSAAGSQLFYSSPAPPLRPGMGGGPDPTPPPRASARAAGPDLSAPSHPHPSASAPLCALRLCARARTPARQRSWAGRAEEWSARVKQGLTSARAGPGRAEPHPPPQGRGGGRTARRVGRVARHRDLSDSPGGCLTRSLHRRPRPARSARLLRVTGADGSVWQGPGP